jgi:aldehyde:ferredoxin oxidoreductase
VTFLLKGYAGKILRINLTNEEIIKQDILDLFTIETLKEYIGCFGLGLKILYDELPLGVPPLDPQNILIFMTGPLTGIPIVPSPTNTTAVTLNADTGFTVGRSHSHGFWGPMLKFAGYDGIIIKGAARNPVYVWIHDEDVEIRDASKFWGLDTHETEDMIKTDISKPKASVAAIGPAGENMIAGALIENDKNHSFAHSGVGAVMGSKKLKAIAVYGSKKVNVHSEEELKQICNQWRENLFKSDVAKGEAHAGAIKEDYSYEKSMSIASAKNFLELPLDQEWGVGLSQNKITPKPCFACPIACSYDAEITYGPYKGYVATLSGGGENLEGAAAICGVYDSAVALYLTDLCDRLGIETSTVGCTIALLIECYEKGLLTQNDTDGIDLRWGDAYLLEKLFRIAAKREGMLGKLISLGPKRAAEFVGGDATKFAIHIKGAGMNLHDWRAAWGVLLGQILGGGASWAAPAVDVYGTEPDVGFQNYQNPFDWRAKPIAVAKTWPKKYWDDCHGTCWFATWGVPGSIAFTTKAFAAATGLHLTEQEAINVGKRLINLERVFNIRRGLTPSDDYEVSPRIISAQPGGKGFGKSIAPYVKGLVMEVYRLLGWDEKTGKPWKQTLQELRLDYLIKDVWL